jgi:hypothetical protein
MSEVQMLTLIKVENGKRQEVLCHAVAQTAQFAIHSSLLEGGEKSMSEFSLSYKETGHALIVLIPFHQLEALEMLMAWCEKCFPTLTDIHDWNPRAIEFYVGFRTQCNQLGLDFSGKHLPLNR